MVEFPVYKWTVFLLTNIKIASFSQVTILTQGSWLMCQRFSETKPAQVCKASPRKEPVGTSHLHVQFTSSHM